MNQLFSWIADIFKEARFWQVVAPWERAVRVRAGKHTVLWGPGLHFRIPYLDDVRLVNTRLRVASAPCQTLSTLDGKAVTVASLIGFRIVDPLKAMLRMADPESCCSSFVQTEVARYISARTSSAIHLNDLEEATLAGLERFGNGGFEFEFVRVVDYAVVKTFRLLQEQWRPHTGGTTL